MSQVQGSARSPTYPPIERRIPPPRSASVPTLSSPSDRRLLLSTSLLGTATTGLDDLRVQISIDRSSDPSSASGRGGRDHNKDPLVPIFFRDRTLSDTEILDSLIVRKGPTRCYDLELSIFRLALTLPGRQDRTGLLDVASAFARLVPHPDFTCPSSRAQHIFEAPEAPGISNDTNDIFAAIRRRTGNRCLAAIMHRGGSRGADPVGQGGAGARSRETYCGSQHGAYHSGLES